MLEGVAGLVIITIGVVGAVLLLLNVGVASFYKERLGFVTQQAATFASKRLSSSDLQESTKAITEALLTENGLPPTVQFEAKKVTVNNRDFARVSLSVAGLTLIGNGDLLPKAITLSDTASALSPNSSGGGDSGDGEVAIWINGDGGRGGSHLLFLQGKEVDIAHEPGRPLLFLDAIKNKPTLTIAPNGAIPGNNHGANDLPVRVQYKSVKATDS